MTNNTGKMTNNLFNNKFSFPINIQEFFINNSCDLKWLEKHSTLINEVYISSDFMNLNFKDMNGKNSHNDYSSEYIINFLYAVKKLDIKICVIFNDIYLTKDDMNAAYKQLEEFESLIDILVVPNSEWLTQMKRRFHFEIKNTVINLPTYNDIISKKYDNYDMIYIHDEIIHNLDKYYNIKGDRKFGTVVNYNDCATFCQFKDKHYDLVKQDKYDGNLFCPTSKFDPIELLLKRNSIPGYYSEFLKYTKVLDIFKLQGRNTAGSFKSAMQIIENIYNKNEILYDDYEKLDRSDSITPLSLFKWKVHVRNCGGDCPSCDYCDKLRIQQ